MTTTATSTAGSSRTLLVAEPRPELVLAAKAGPGAARDELIEAFAPLLASVARRYRHSANVDLLELRQEGVVGLLRALERFDPAQGTPFWAYATWWVRQAMQQVVAELARPVVLSDRAARQLARVQQARRVHEQAHGREPRRCDLAEDTGLTQREIDSLFVVDRTPRPLHAPFSAHEGSATIGEQIADPHAEEAYEAVRRRIAADGLDVLLGGLSERERAILVERFGLSGRPEQSRRELSRRLGMSAERVRQIERRALDKLRLYGLRAAIDAKTM